MSTTAANFKLVGEIFNAACKLEAPARDVFLLQQCADDPKLLAQLRALFRADGLAEGVLDRAALQDSINLAAIQSSLATPAALPERVGSYRILRAIGEGGMGIVYEAEQDEPRRRVALKVIRPGLVSPNLLRRFRHEAEMLGRLKHAGIAQIYEAGTADEGNGSQPFFAMELVNGRPLIEFAKAHDLSNRQRLELVARICDAVHHAHLNGIIHRDLKPGNILVTSEASTSSQNVEFAQPKILDFGIARATEADIQTVTLRTDVGQLLGTIAYMSPEQALGDPASLDIRSDVYALGVIAYELLTGRLPYNVQGKMIHEAVRVIREDEPSSLSSISRVFRGDIETIISKALEKDKQRRYQSAADFASDIRRYLDEQPIAARPASRLYQLRKFARRNKAIVAGVAIAFIAMLAGTIVSTRQAILAERARDIADERTRQAEWQSYRASMVAASSALRYHEIPDAKRQLEAAPAHLRGWEFNHLANQLDHGLRQLETGSTPQAIAVAPAGDVLALVNSGGNIQLRRIVDWTLIAKTQVSGGTQQRRINHMKFSSDGAYLDVQANVGFVRLDGRTLEVVDRTDLTSRMRSPDGRFVVILEDKDTDRLVIVDHVSEREVFSLQRPDMYIYTIAFSPDSQRLFLAGDSREGLMIFRTADGSIERVLAEHGVVRDIAFNSDSSRAALAKGSGEVAVIDVATGADLYLLRGHAAAVLKVAFSPDDAVIASTSGDRTIRTWRAADGAALSVMHGPAGTCETLAFAPDGKSIFTTAGKLVWHWDATLMHNPFVLPTSGLVYGMAFSPDGKRIAAASLGGENPLRVWDFQTCEQVLATGEGNMSALAVNSDGTQLAIGRSGTSSTSIFNLEGSEIASVAGHWWRTDWVSFHQNDQKLLSLGNGGRLVEHDIATGDRKRVRNFPALTEGEGCRATFNSDKSILAVASRNIIYLLNATTFEELAKLQAKPGNIYALAFSPDGKRLVAGSSNRNLSVWDVEKRELIATLESHSAEVFAVAFTPDGSRFVSGGRDRVIRVWHAQRLEEVTQLHGHTSLVYCLAFSRDGKTLASGGGDGVRLWSTKPYREFKRTSE